MVNGSVLLVSPYWLPSNLSGVQRVRVMSRALRDYGWAPTIVTVDYHDYEELPDLSSLRLIRADVPVEVLRDVIQPFPTFSEAVFYALRELPL